MVRAHMSGPHACGRQAEKPAGSLLDVQTEQNRTAKFRPPQQLWYIPS